MNCVKKVLSKFVRLKRFTQSSSRVAGQGNSGPAPKHHLSTLQNCGEPLVTHYPTSTYLQAIRFV